MRVAVVVLFVASILTFVFTTEYIVVEDFFDELEMKTVSPIENS